MSPRRYMTLYLGRKCGAGDDVVFERVGEHRELAELSGVQEGGEGKRRGVALRQEEEEAVDHVCVVELQELTLP